MKTKKRVEILAPCGDMDALVSAIASGADAVYFGLDIFNARIRAKNFTLDTLLGAVELCHAHGIKAYVTLNTQLYDRELETMLEYVGKIWACGVDALIVADLGVISLVRKYYPDLELHASTQCTVHNLDGAELLWRALGISRVVLARELDKESIKYITEKSHTEIEIFVHGAHCMSVSGQCLLSFAMGGRSGNRGECAQPCRLPYTLAKKQSYPLSLKDMSLSSHVTELLDMGVSSLKIEGRMKGAEYVSTVVSTWKRLVSEKRNATGREKSLLETVFSRQGFTDGYFTGNIGASMLGIRSEENKRESRDVALELPTLKMIKLKGKARLIVGERAELTLSDGKRTKTAYGDIVEEARTAPLSYEEIKASLSKMGATPFEIEEMEIEKSESVMLRKSALNALRREAVGMLLNTSREEIDIEYESVKAPEVSKKIRTCVFESANQIPKSYEYFDIRFLPVHKYRGEKEINGISMPPVILDREWSEIEPMLKSAKANGVEYALACNIGQIDRLKKHGFTVLGDFRFNAFNAPCVDFLRKQGLESLIMSPEMTLAQLRPYKGYIIVTYGKLPLMVSHKCIIKDSAGCEKCKAYLKDRQGAELYTSGTFGHRCVIHNSVPIYMADKKDTIDNYSQHFIFTDESAEECETVISAYKKGLSTQMSIRRIK